MMDVAAGPFLFDTSAESWFARAPHSAAKNWFVRYVALYPVHISAATVIERIRGYAHLAMRADDKRRGKIEIARLGYLANLGRVWPIDAATAVVAGEIMGAAPEPPSPPKRSHLGAESRQSRVVRWRFDALIAATALVTNLTLIHNNAVDFEHIRGTIEKAPGRFPKLGPLQLARCDSLA